MTVSQDHVAECSILLNFYHENNTEFLKGSSIAGCTCSKKSENVQNLFFEHKSVKKKYNFVFVFMHCFNFYGTFGTFLCAKLLTREICLRKTNYF